MSSAKEYREFARECMDWARTARSEQERAIFTQMAQTWIEAAARIELAPLQKTEDVLSPAFADAPGREEERRRGAAKADKP
jgi:hypothetical protein